MVLSEALKSEIYVPTPYIFVQIVIQLVKTYG